MTKRYEYQVIEETTVDGAVMRSLQYRCIFGRFNFLGLNVGHWWHVKRLGADDSAAKFVAEHRAEMAREVVAKSRVTQRFQAKA